MKQIKRKLQVDSNHYQFQTYSTERRFVSYYHQVKWVYYFVEKHKAKNILVIGKGDGVVPKILEAYSELFRHKLKIHTYDFAKYLKPTFLGDIKEVGKIVQKKYDVVVCCQMLEHVPFEDAKSALKQIRKITKYLVLSLPYKALTFRATISIPIIKEKDFMIKIPIIRKKGMVDERHYWELGASISVNNFNKIMKSLKYKLHKSYTVKKHGNHHFIIYY